MTFRTDSAFNFFQVLHLQRYLKGHKGYIAGGVFKNIFKDQKVKDVDIFFENKEDFDTALNLFENSDKYKQIYENDNAVGFYDLKSEIGIDLVRSSFLPPKEMLKTFDFTITKFALFEMEVEINEEENENNSGLKDFKNTPDKQTELTVVYHELFFEHLTLNRLVIDEDIIIFPLNTFDRMLRYAKYGYAPCTGTKAKIVRSINMITLPDDDTNLFKGFYVGID